MPQLIVTSAARSGLQRCRSFLAQKNPEAARRSAEIIGRHLATLQASPKMGRPVVGDPAMRELVIPFGDSGYVALYVYKETADAVIILAFRHQREAGH
jgi:plasmid stabilization system protein ParE